LTIENDIVDVGLTHGPHRQSKPVKCYGGDH
jgi:hypothetical protein